MSGWGPRLRLRVEQTAPRAGDVPRNLARLAAAQADAARDGCDLVVTPELSVTGYELRDRVHTLARPESDAPFPALADGPDLVVGTAERDAAGVPFNVRLHLRGGRVLHRHRKVYLPTYGMFDEGRYWGAGDEVRAYDAGGGWRPGILVCEDLWHPSLAWLLAGDGANLLLATTGAAGRGTLAGGPGGARFANWETWEVLARAAALAYGVYVVVANQTGVEGPCVYAGGSLVVAPDGTVLARARDDGEDRLNVELSLDAVAAARRPFSHARDDDARLVARMLARRAG